MTAASNDLTTRKCYVCGAAENFPQDPAKGRKVELRPYGAGGQDICYQCMTATPEREETAKRNFGVQLDANEVVGGGTTLLTSDGPVPFSEEALSEETEKSHD